MLVLSRLKNESIMIGDIEVFIIDIRGDKVRIGIEAPKDVPVHRREIYDIINKSPAIETLSDENPSRLEINQLDTTGTTE